MRIILFFSFCITLLFNSCIKQETGKFQREYFMTLEIPPDANPLFTHIFEQRIASTWIQFLIENGLDQSDIKAIKPRSIILSPIFDNPISYDIITEGHVSIYPTLSPNQVLPIAEVYNPLGSGDELFFLPGLANVIDIISQPEFVLKLALNFRSIPGSFSEHHLRVRFDIFLN